MKAARDEVRAGELSGSLLDLRFLELDVLAGARIVLLEAQLLGLGARILLRHVEEACIGGADELDLDGCRLGHRTVPNAEKRKAACRRPFGALHDECNRFCQPTHHRNGPLTFLGEPAFKGSHESLTFAGPSFEEARHGYRS